MSGSVEEFKKALGGEIVESVARPGALAVTEILGTRSWFDSRSHQSDGQKVEEERWKSQ